MSEKVDYIQMWKDCCEACNVQFVSKGTYEYLQVKELFDHRKSLIDEERESKKTPSMKLWERCCEELGFDYVKKGTQNYNMVKSLFLKRAKVELEDKKDNNCTRESITSAANKLLSITSKLPSVSPSTA
jgi:hypothetical protein